MSAAPNSESRGLGDFARADAPRANPDVHRPSVDHRTHPLEVRQPAPFRYVVSVRDIAAAHRPLAADFTSLRHVRTPSRNPRTGVKFNSTGGSNYQVSAKDCHPIFRPFRAQNMRRAAKRTEKNFVARRNHSRIFTLFAAINDTLIRRRGPVSVLDNCDKPMEPDFEKTETVVRPGLMRRLVV